MAASMMYTTTTTSSSSCDDRSTDNNNNNHGYTEEEIYSPLAPPITTATATSHDNNKFDAGKTMMITVSTSIMSLNNTAVEFMERGMFREATGALQTAYDRLEILVELQNAASSNGAAPSPQEQQQHLPLHANSLGQRRDNNYNSSSTALETVFTLFNRAFVFPDTAALLQQPQQQESRISFACPKVQSQIQGMITFNLALCYHNTAMELGSSKCLVMALRLYERSYSVIRDSWEGSSLEPVLLILMSLFNNMGHIHSNTFDMERTRNCINWLKSAIAWKGSTSIGDAYFFFFKNISYIPLTEPTLAPAA